MSDHSNEKVIDCLLENDALIDESSSLKATRIVLRNASDRPSTACCVSAYFKASNADSLTLRFGATLLNGFDLLRFALQQPHYREAFCDVLTMKKQKTQKKDAVFVEEHRFFLSRFFFDRNLSSQSVKKSEKSEISDAALSAAPSLPPSISSVVTPFIFVTGGGIFYFWKAGFLRYLSQHFDLSPIVFVGTSAGALASVLVCCNAHITKASRLAIRLAIQDGAWERPYFLAGILQSLARRWLETVIPDDPLVLQSIRRRLVLAACRVSRVRLEGLCDFPTRQDLIDCLLASMHIPFYANGKFMHRVRESNYIDGCFGPALLRAFGEAVPHERILVIRCSGDDNDKAISRRECIKKVPPERLCIMMQEGYNAAKKKHKAGELALLSPYEKYPCGTYCWEEDPYVDYTRICDPTLP